MKKKKKRKGKKFSTHSNPSIMRKAHIHTNEDAKRYNRKKTRKEERNLED